MNQIENWLITNPQFLEIRQALHPFDFECVKEILRNSELDLSPGHGGFDAPQFSQIYQKTISLFFEKVLKCSPQMMDHEQIRFLWRETLHSFSKNYWGLSKIYDENKIYRPQALLFKDLKKREVSKKPIPPPSKKEAFFYIWAILQSWIIVKALMLVFGNELAKDDTLKNRIIFGVLMAFSFGSLFYFAYSRHRKINRKE